MNQVALNTVQYTDYLLFIRRQLKIIENNHKIKINYKNWKLIYISLHYSTVGNINYYPRMIYECK